MQRILLVALVAMFTSAAAEELAPLEAYASLPEYDLYELSPNGERGAMRYTTSNTDVVVVKQIKTGEIVSGVDASEADPRSIVFVGEDKVLLVAGATVRSSRIRGLRDDSAGFSLDDTRSKDWIRPTPASMTKITAALPVTKLTSASTHMGSRRPIFII